MQKQVDYLSVSNLKKKRNLLELFVLVKQELISFLIKEKKKKFLGGEAVGVWIQKQLHAQYFEAFNFYFAKGINEILANLSISHVILFKDYLFFDDDSEYLKRYYREAEIPPRVNLLTEFYAN